MTEFVLNGTPVAISGDHEHLLAALRDEAHVFSPKDGCSPDRSVRLLHRAGRRQGAGGVPDQHGEERRR